MFRREALELGRYKRDPNRWQTEFGRWVADFGVPRIVTVLGQDPNLRVTKHAVYHWLKGYAPRPDRALALVEMSQGRLTLEAIYQHGQQMKQSDGDARGPQ